LGYKDGLRWALWRLGEVVSDQGDIARATGLLRECLNLQQQLADKFTWIGSLLELFAGLLARQGEAERAAQLFGAAEALRATMGVPRPPSEHRVYERNVAATSALLDRSTFATAWREGQAMSPEQAVAYALEETT
jgi:hypothetical protein